MSRVLLSVLILLLTSCSYNPFSSNNHTTGSPTGAVAGAAIGGGGVAALGGSKTLMAGTALLGGVIGYYVTTQRYDAGGIIQAGGQVYNVGEYAGIYIPTDKLFEPNTADFLPQAPPILDSVMDVLSHYPNSNILISGNTSGFGHSRWEQRLSEKRAEKVAAYLWNAGINQFKERSSKIRRLNYVGYGDYFPIATNLNNSGIRKNSRIQITIYPSCADLHLNAKDQTMYNVGSTDDEDANYRCASGRGRCYKN